MGSKINDDNVLRLVHFLNDSECKINGETAIVTRANKNNFTSVAIISLSDCQLALNLSLRL